MTVVRRLLLAMLCCLPLGACGVAALPFRVTGDVLSAVPVIGKPLGAPVHAVGDAID